MSAVAKTTTTVRIGRRAHAQLREIATRTGEPLSDVLERAIELEERRLFWQQFREAVERLRSDTAAWEAHVTEGRDLEGTLGDGIDPDEDWSLLAAAKPDEIEFLDPEDEQRAPAR